MLPSALYRPSLALLTDLYQLTMVQGYWKLGRQDDEARVNSMYSGVGRATLKLLDVLGWTEADRRREMSGVGTGVIIPSLRGKVDYTFACPQAFCGKSSRSNGRNNRETGTIFPFCTGDEGKHASHGAGWL